MSNETTIMENLRDDLRDNIEDPIQRQGQWIHLGEINTQSKTPAVYIDLAPSPNIIDFVGGNQKRFLNVLVHVVVGNKDQGRVNIDNILTQITSSDELRDRIMDAIISRWENSDAIGSYDGGVALDHPIGNWRLNAQTKVKSVRFLVDIL